MGWKNSAKTTVGRDWGKAPSLVEGIPARLSLPASASKVRAWKLDERGQRADRLTIGESKGKAAIEIGPKYRTIWYEVEVQR
jgi:hypothetical protein